MEKTYIFGHHNPDTDSVCSAIGLAYYKNRLGYNTVPCIIDEINLETKFALDYFNAPVPKYLDNVKLQIKDVDYHKNYIVKDTDSIKQVYDFLISKDITGVPVASNDGDFIGLITMKNILNILIGNDLRKIDTSYNNIVSVLEGKEVLRFNDNISGDVIVGGFKSSDFMEEVLVDSDTILIAANRPTIIKYAIRCGIKTIIVVGSLKLDDECLLLAKENKVNVISTNYDSFYSSKLISLSTYCKNFCDPGRIICFKEEDYYNDFVDTAKKLKHNNYPVIDEKGKCLGLLRITDIDNVNKKKVILVDHNESSQSVLGLNQAEIVEIIDHHKIGDLTTNNPINFRNMAVGSTCTIVYELFADRNMDIPFDIAGLLLSGILSDTIILKSPTTTLYDKEAVKSLSSILNIDYEEYGTSMFKAGASLKGKTKEEIINTDIKSFTYGKDLRYAVSQVFTLDIEEILKDKESYISLIENMCKNMDYKFVVLVITDVLNDGSYFLYTDYAYEVLKMGYGDIKEGSYVDGEISRKKQIIPKIISGLDRINS